MPSRRFPDPFAAQLGARIRQLRNEKQMSLAVLGQAAGLSRGHLSDIERGKTVMRIGTLERIAGALNVPAYIICLIPKEALEVAVIDQAIARAGGDSEKAAVDIRNAMAEVDPQESSPDATQSGE